MVFGFRYNKNAIEKSNTSGYETDCSKVIQLPYKCLFEMRAMFEEHNFLALYVAVVRFSIFLINPYCCCECSVTIAILEHGHAHSNHFP